MTDLQMMRFILDKAAIEYSLWPYPDEDTVVMEIEPKSRQDDQLLENIWFDFTKDGSLKSCGNFIAQGKD